MKKWLRKIIVWGALIYGSILGALVLFESSLLFPAPSPSDGDWDASEYDAIEEWADSSDGTKVHVWCLVHKSPRATIIFSHGNGESLGYLGYELAQLRDRLAVNVIAYDYRGYGKTGGKPNEKSILEDAVAVANWASRTSEWNQVPIVPMGRSLGGAAAIEMATKLNAPGVVLDRTFSSIVEVASHHYPVFPVRLLMRNRFRSVDKISEYSGKVLQVHGDRDSVVPLQFGKKLFDACPSDSKEFIEVHGLRHNDSWPREFWVAMDRFLQSIRP